MVRPREDRVVAGVALAVANRLGMAPGAVRLVWFILGFFGGLGVLLYVAGWLLIPEEGDPTSIAEDTIGRLSDSTAWVGVIPSPPASSTDSSNLMTPPRPWSGEPLTGLSP